MRLGLVSAAYPPDLDGIGDYTWWMAKTLAERDDVERPVTVFTRIGDDHRPAPGVEVMPFFDPTHAHTFNCLLGFFSPASDSQLSTVSLDWLVLQYNPFGWGRRGYCPAVPPTLRRLRRMTGAPRLAVMFHETKVPCWPWKYSVMQMWQFPIFRSVCRAAEVAFVSTSKWAPQVRRASATVPIRHLPVGSNIPVKKMPINEARRQCGIDPDAVVVGVFGAAHVSRLLDWIATATLRLQRDYPNTVLLYIGRDGSKVIEACQGVKVIDTGTLLSEAMSAYFCAMDFCLAPFVDGLCSRRGSIIALLQHGIPVAGRSKPFVDQVFEKFSTETPASVQCGHRQCVCRRCRVVGAAIRIVAIDRPGASG